MERVLSETRLLWSDTVVQYFNLLFLCFDTIMAALSHRGRALFSSSVVDPDDEWDDPNLRSGGDDDDDQPRSFGGGGSPGGLMTFGVEEETVVEAQAVKPFVGAIFPPSSYQNIQNIQHSGTPSSSLAAPAATLRLEYVFGYCKKTRAAVFSLPGGGRTFWPSAAVGVMHDSSRSGAERQSFLIGHEDEITAAAQCPGARAVVATGCSQLKRKGDTPKIIVWDTASGHPLAELQSRHLKRQVDALAFDGSGRFVFAVGAGDRHNVVVFDVQQQQQIGPAVSTGSSRALAMSFDARNEGLYVAGVKSLLFLPFSGGRLGPPTRISSETCVSIACSPDDGVAYVGLASGRIATFQSGSASGTKPRPAHKGGVWSIAVSADGSQVASGGKDGSVTLWNCSGGGALRKERKVMLSQPSACKALAFDQGGDLLCGTKAGKVVRLYASGSWHEESVVAGHFDGETWGLAMHPFDHQAVTTGDDNTLRIWDLVHMEVLRSCELTQVKPAGGQRQKKSQRSRRAKAGGVATTGSFAPANCSRAVDYDPMGEVIAVGMNDGSFMVFREGDLEVVAHKRGKGRSQWVQDLKYSPVDQVLAVSTHDNFVDLWRFGADNKYKRFATLEGHRSFITHLDWSADGRYIQTNCGAYELLFWDTQSVSPSTKKVERVGRASSLCDVEWQTQNCVIGWPCTGIWYSPEGYMLNSCDKSKGGDLLVVGEDSSQIKLYKYPCTGTFVKSGRDPKLGGAKGNVAIGHGSHVSNVRFAFDDTKVVSVGGDDNATMVWSVDR